MQSANQKADAQPDMFAPVRINATRFVPEQDWTGLFAYMRTNPGGRKRRGWREPGKRRRRARFAYMRTYPTVRWGIGQKKSGGLGEEAAEAGEDPAGMLELALPDGQHAPAGAGTFHRRGAQRFTEGGLETGEREAEGNGGGHRFLRPTCVSSGSISVLSVFSVVRRFGGFP